VALVVVVVVAVVVVAVEMVVVAVVVVEWARVVKAELAPLQHRHPSFL
jgi:hypothetical protein